MTNPSPLSGNSDAITEKLELADPLIVTSVIAAALRMRFAAGQIGNVPALPEWDWSSDIKTTKLFIEEGYQINAEARNKRPAIYVDRLAHTSGKVSVGLQDQESADLKTGLRRYHTFADMDLSVMCQASTRGESTRLAAAAHLFLLCTQVELMTYFGLRDFTAFTVGRTVQDERDKEMWNTDIQFRVQYELRWNTQPMSLELAKVVMTLLDKNTLDTRELRAPSRD